MGFRFRKSINLGGGFKVNLSKSGVGYSWGTKGVRYTKTATGKKRTTLSIPGTGISHVSESGGKRKSTKQQNKQAKRNFTAPNPNNSDHGGNNMAWVKLVICFFFGFFGIHKFMEKKIGMGILYLFTMGLFGFGWIYDCIKYLIAAIKSVNTNGEEPIQEAGKYAKTATEYPPEEIPASDGSAKIKKILLWVLTVFLAIIALAYLPHISGIIAFAAAIIVAPVAKWQNKISQYIKGKPKTIAVTAMALLSLLTAPATDTPEVQPTVPTVAIIETTEVPTTVATTETTTAPATEAATEATTEPATETTAEATTEAATESTAEPATEAAAETTAEATTEPAEVVDEGITFLSWPETISRNETGTVKIKGKPNTEYSITVYYKSGASTAKGLETKTSNSEGYVSWTWKVGGRTSLGTFRIVVSGGGDKETVNFTIN